jgi:hypothetical protein
MANSTSSQVILDGSRRAVIKFEGVLDSSNLALTAVIAPSTLQGMRNWPSAGVPTTVRIVKIWHNVEDGLSLDFFWEATVAKRVESLTGRANPSYRDFGGLGNNAGVGKTGRLMASSHGWSGVKSFSVIIEVEKEDSQVAAVAPVGPTYILSTLGLPVAFAVGLRRLNDTYNAALVRVRRSSDNLELDIGATAGGDLDEAALLAHVGAGDGFVVTVYDQSGNIRNLTQANTAYQPAIVVAGAIVRISTAANRASFKTTALFQAMTAAAFTVAQPFTRSSVLQFIAPQDFGTVFANVGNTMLLTFSMSKSLYTYAGSILTVQTITTGAAATIVEILNGVSSEASYNGAVVTGNAGTSDFSNFTLGDSSLNTPVTATAFGDIIVFPSALSTIDRQTLELNQKTYYGTP